MFLVAVIVALDPEASRADRPILRRRGWLPCSPGASS
jgi:hypothetical protein